MTEFSEDFNRICVALNKEIRPRGIIEEMYVSDIAHHTFDIVRGHRWKAAIINSEFRAALASLISGLLREPGYYEEGSRSICQPGSQDPREKLVHRPSH